MKYRINYTIKGLNIFGIVITTKKQLENCDVYINIGDEE